MHLSFPILLAIGAAILVLGILIGWNNGKKAAIAKEAQVKTQVKSWFDAEIIKAKTEVGSILASIKAKL